MPDSRRHRGPDPEDAAAFGPAALPGLRGATADLNLLLDRGYALASSLKLVGDRHALTRRQRAAVARCAADAARVRARQAHLVAPDALRGEALAIDGFNVLTTLEVALAGGIVLIARDGTMRDIAGVHGTHRVVEETVPALELLAEATAVLGVGRCTLWFDRPVSNSGRLAALVTELAGSRGWPFASRVVPDPDRELAVSREIVASADGALLDRCARWCNLARLCIAARVPAARVVDLSG